MEYKPGLVSASLSLGKKATERDPFLVQLFSKPKRPKKISEPSKPEKKEIIVTKQNAGGAVQKSSNGYLESSKKVLVKRKNQDTTSPTLPKKAKKESSISLPPVPASNNDFPFVHESLLQQKFHSRPRSQQEKPKEGKKKIKARKLDERDEQMMLSTRKRNRRDKTADNRTVFVGNCPLSSDKKAITKLFKDFGAIESIRFRCGPAATLDLPRRAVIIKKEFHEKASSYVSYIVFKEEDSAQKALEMNGHVLEGLHLRVDLASNHKKHDKKRSVFVGNLPFTVTEEDLRSHFLDCGDINNVRIIRDRQTSIGKGIAYIQFETKDGVTLAKKLDDKDFQGRKLRVKTCVNKPEKKVDGKLKMKDKLSASKPLNQPDKKRIGFAPSNRKSSAKKSFQEILQANKDKRLKKSKKKKQPTSKSDGLSSIFGDMSADMKRLKADNPKFRDKKKKDKTKTNKDKKNKNIKKGDKGVKKMKKIR